MFQLRFFVTGAVNRRVLVNAALNQPAFMSSVHFDSYYGGAFGPWKGNDGNNDPIALKRDNSCVVTTVDVDPWWAVDLGAPLRVLGVYLSSRAEGWGNNLSFRYYNPVGLTY